VFELLVGGALSPERPETIDHTGHSPEKPKVDQPASGEAQQAARES
jgi:hypothetical protein